MRLLIVCPTVPFWPCHDLARVVPAQLLLNLSSRHTVTLVAGTHGGSPADRRWAGALADHVEIVTAGRWRRPMSGVPGEGLDALGAAVARTIDAVAPEVMHLDSAWLAPLARLGDVPTVLACQVSAALRARQARRLARGPWEWMRAHVDARVEAAWERRWFPAADAWVVASEEHRRELAAAVPFARIAVIPPGIDAREHGVHVAAEPSRIAFTGTLHEPPDAEAARRLALQIFPRVHRAWPRAELLIAGDSPAPAVRALAAAPGVRVTGASPDVRTIVRSAAVYASPLDAGFGAKSRLLEAMAVGTPVVASRRNLSGLGDVLPSHHVLTADTDEDFADAIVMLMREPVVARTMAKNARDLVQARFTWPAVVRQYEALYEQVVEARTPALAAA
jgi:glycosyltransferase involved in cell wall biosynthesis